MNLAAAKAQLNGNDEDFIIFDNRYFDKLFSQLFIEILNFLISAIPEIF